MNLKKIAQALTFLLLLQFNANAQKVVQSNGSEVDFFNSIKDLEDRNAITPPDLTVVINFKCKRNVKRKSQTLKNNIGLKKSEKLRFRNKRNNKAVFENKN